MARRQQKQSNVQILRDSMETCKNKILTNCRKNNWRTKTQWKWVKNKISMGKFKMVVISFAKSKK